MALSDIAANLLDNYFIKLIYLVHATLLTLANIANFSNQSIFIYTSYNTLFLLTVLLAIILDKNSDIALVATASSALCIILDIVFLLSSSYVGVLAVILMVFNFVLRILSTALLLRNYGDRSGIEVPTTGLLEVSMHAGQPSSTYQNIDEPSQTLP